jgi:hypothetical protein
MNERIQELAEQANEWASKEESWKAHSQLFTEKFAELIVRECINQAHSVGDLRGVNDDMVYGADTAAVQISKYFGDE